MCGIAALWGSSAADCADVVTLMQLLTPVINNRGPDYHSSLVVEGVTLLCSVLHIQGDEITVQPQSDSDGNLLLWNGEVFGGLDYSVGVESDTVAVSRLLQSCTTLLSSPFEVAGAIAECLKGVQGPYAFVFMHKSTGSVHFARDPIGRRSLIAIYHNDSIVGIASVALDLLGFLEGYSLQEMSVEGIFTLALKSPDRVVSTSPWPADTIKLKRRNSFTNNDSVDESLVSYSSLEREFLIVLQEAVGKRVRSISKHCHSTIEQKCRVGVLFSGGIDSVMLAALLHLCLEHVNEPIELINVTFYSEDDRASEPPSPDRLAAIGAYVELKVSNRSSKR